MEEAMEDLLGYDRFERSTDWRCSGRIEGDLEGEERTFVVERHGDRWLVTSGDGRLISVGDETRDLVAADGGLVRKPAPIEAIGGSMTVNLLRRLGVMERAFVTSGDVLDRRASRRAGRPSVDVRVQIGDYDITLGVDDETGLWTFLQTSGFSIIVDELVASPSLVTSAAFTVLDIVPDIDLSHREPVAPSLASALRVLEDASGLQGGVLWQSEDTGEFRFILTDADGKPQAVVERVYAGAPQSPSLFAGMQHRSDTDDWSFHVDTTRLDPLWSKPIVVALQRL